MNKYLNYEMPKSALVLGIFDLGRGKQRAIEGIMGICRTNVAK